MKKYKWGIMGLGKIANTVCEDLALMPNVDIYAVASRSQEKADAFAQKFGATLALDSYEKLLKVKDLDVIYIATPHSEHYQNTLDCLEAGIPILCEKAFAFNAKQVRTMVAKAQEKQVFLMEAIWTRFHPAVAKVQEILESGVLGRIVHLSADFGFQPEYNENSRLFDPNLAGGSLLDIGLYPLFISKLLLGKPKALKAVGVLTPTGVDMNTSMALSYESGATASLFSTFATRTDSTCTIYGTKGKLLMQSRFHETFGLTLHITGEDEQIIPTERIGHGYTYEADHVHWCLENNLTESPLLPLQFSIELIEMFDEIRRQIGVKYPAD